ncbi:MAG: hypothetical protein KDE46_30060, partial [Caldilineaceae bacterium]|nr:hypothetical protein [Caldilineaceae bacterium]
DWQRTPATVQNALTDALHQIAQLRQQLQQANANQSTMRQSVYRDGGLSTGRTPFTSAKPSEQSPPNPTRGNVLRGGQLRSGQRIDPSTDHNSLPDHEDGG